MVKDIPWDEVYGLLLGSGSALAVYLAFCNYIMDVKESSEDNTIHPHAKDDV